MSHFDVLLSREIMRLCSSELVQTFNTLIGTVGLECDTLGNQCLKERKREHAQAFMLSSFSICR